MSHIVPGTESMQRELTTNVVASDAVRVHVFWGDALLQVVELSPPRAFYVGDGGRKDDEPVDFTVPELAERTALLTVEGGRVVVHAPQGAALSSPDEPWSEFGDVAELGDPTNPFFDATSRVRAPSDARALPVDIWLGALRFSFTVGEREARCPRSLDAEEGVRPLAFFAAASLFVGTLAGLMAFFTPPLGLTDDEGADHDRVYVMNQYLDAAAEREHEPEHADGHDTGQSADAPDAPARGEAGRIGHPSPVAHSMRGSGSEQGAVQRPALSR
ncbi:MAG TPA: hypothetical protein VHU80_05870, partial [Polyangiaceae bacterium]|nr:hypothetical protein [Polyangiaceae bacterium]